MYFFVLSVVKTKKPNMPLTTQTSGSALALQEETGTDDQVTITQNGSSAKHDES